MTASTISLFRATKAKPAVNQGNLMTVAPSIKPETRDPLDYDPTPADATAAFLAAEGDRMREIGGPVWEPAVGGGHMAKVLSDHGFQVRGSDIVQRDHVPTCLGSFFDFQTPASNIIVTNPPYNEVSARDGHGRWLRHCQDLGVDYFAMLLNWDWIAARTNGMDALHERFPVSRVYVCCWKIDFRGAGSPPQRNGWLVWDRAWQSETVLRRLFRDVPDDRQGVFL